MDPVNEELADIATVERRWFRDRYDILLVLLVALLVTFGFDRESTVLSFGTWIPRVLEAVLVLAIVVVGMAASGGLRDRTAGLVTVITTVLVVAAVFEQGVTGGRRRFGWAVLVVLMALLAALILRRILSHPRIDRRTVLGALCVYLILGYLFAFAVLFLHNLDPGQPIVRGPDGAPVVIDGRTATVNDPTAGNGITNTGDPKRAVRATVDYVYFSYITLTTVGYGDFVPKGNPVRITVVLEAITGQLLLVTLVARLVSNLGTTRDPNPQRPNPPQIG